MPQCQGIKTNGERCARGDSGFIHLTATHLHFCNTHWGVYDRRTAIRAQVDPRIEHQHHRNGTCHTWVANRRWCGQLCEENALLCIQHSAAIEGRRIRRDTAAQRERERLADIQTLVDEYRNRNPVLTWQQMVDDMFVNRRPNVPLGIMHGACRIYFAEPVAAEPGVRHHWQFQRYWIWNVNGRIGDHPDLINPNAMPPPPAHRLNNLAAIAADRQNVHTQAVSQQTNKGLEKLLEKSRTSAPLRGPEWFAARWLLRTYGDWERVVRIVNDMHRWYDTRTCRTRDDWLYRKALDGLYITVREIEDAEIRHELFKRTFEECFESVGMCCDGHISRLCNVLVGFDDTFVPPVPFGDILQNKMAAIAGMEIETSEKIKQATEFFNEFAVPESERTAWLEAF